MKKLLLLIPLLLACTPRERALWDEWFAKDPEAAAEFARNLPRNEPQDEPQDEPSRDDDEPQSGGSVWDSLAECESNGNWDIATGNGYYGGLQFSLISWRAVGGSGYPHHASRSEQIYRAEKLLDLQGWGAWPTCSRQLGLR